MLCDNLEGWDGVRGVREVQKEGDISFPPEMEKISLSRFFWGVGGGPGGQAGFGKELRVWNCI